MAYDQPEDDGPTDPSVIELAEDLLDRCRPLTESSQAWRYLTETRGLPPHAINYCKADLRQLEPPIPGFDQLAYGVVSLLRDRGGDISGIAVEACGPAGERVLDRDGRTARKAFRLRDRGCAEGLFRVKAAAEGAMVCYMTEGRLAKVLAVAAVLEDAAIYGAGGRPSLGSVVPPEPTVVLVSDQRPHDPEEAERHDRDVERACDRLILAGRMVRLAEMGCACCKDLDQALGQHGHAPVREWLVEGAEPVQLSLDGHARRITKITDPLRRAQAIAEIAEQFEFRKQGLTAAFRAEVAKYAGGGPDGGDTGTEPEAKGAPLDVTDTLPWPTEVDAAAVLDRVAELLQAHVVMRSHEARLVALWCAFTHALDFFWFNPRLAIRSPTKRCGKTTLLDIVGELIARPLAAANITEAAVFRTIEAVKPSLLIDEADCYLGENAALRSVLNSGHTRTSAHVIRVVPTSSGEQEPRKFSTWAPIAVALIGKLPGTLADRSIDILLQRKPRSARVRRLRKNRGTELAELRRKLARFATDHPLALEQADPEPPEALHDRMADNVRPLMAIAEVVGGEWPAHAAAAARALGDVDDDHEDLGIQLLADIRAVFGRRGSKPDPDKVWTDELLSALLEMRERPWGEVNHGRGLTARGITQLLRPFKIVPQQVRKGTANKRGYVLSSLEGAFEQYLSATTLHPKETAAYSGFASATENNHVADENSPEAAENLDCSVVADSEPPEGGPEKEAGPTTTGNGAASDVPLECIQCGCSFLHPTGPGRRPKRCPACRGKPRTIKGADTSETTEFLS